MPNTTRNTIVLSVLLILVLVSGFSISRRFSKGAELYKEQNRKLQAKIDVLDYQLSKIDSLRARFDIQQLVAQQSKIIMDKDTPTITYQYLLKLLRWMGRPMIFDFAMSDANTQESAWHEYVISGRSLFSDVVKLATNIEHQRMVVTIEELVVGSDAIANSDTVSYSMIIRTHFQEGGTDPEQINRNNAPETYVGYNSFKSRIYDAPPPQEFDPRLLKLDSAQLIAVTQNRIFVRNDQRVIKILAVGDRIAGGYLYAIDPINGKAIFKVDTYGVLENKTLFINQPN